jgi:predicted AAA+ superfamily ATPase
MINQLRETYHRLVSETAIQSHRFLFETFKPEQRLCGLIGPRGAGKTTLMLQHIRERIGNLDEAFYASADHIYFNKSTLLDFVRSLYMTEGVKLFFLDEVHKYPSWQQELKNIYDSFPSVRVVFSGSSSLELTKGSHDLSRRATLYRLPGLSFREYLNFLTREKHDCLSLDAILKNSAGISSQLAATPKLLGYFNRYLEEGYYPYIFEGKTNHYEKVRSVIEKTVFEDIATYYRLKTENLHYFKKILYFLSTIPPGEVCVHKLGGSLGIDNKTVSHYLSILQETGLIRLLEAGERGHAVVRKPHKIYMDNTTLYHALCEGIGQSVDIGMKREMFFLQATQNINIPVSYSLKGADFKIKNDLFEVGGKGKGRAQLPRLSNQEYVVKDDILIGSKNTIPLYLFGFLY